MSTLTAHQILDRHYLEIRCGLLDVAAALDRVSRSSDATDVTSDPRLELIQRGLEIVSSDGTDRAERLQLLFSDPYVAGWNRTAK